MSNPLISVIITNFNYANFIGEAIESALNQDYSPLEVIVVDDGSTDESLKVLERYRNRIVLVAKENGGVSTARNAGQRCAKGRYIAFLDADDYWDRTKISKQFYRLLESGNQLAYSKMRILDQEGSSFSTNEVREGNFLPVFIRNPGKTPFPPSSVLISTKLIEKVGDWDSSLVNSAEDFDFFRRCATFTEFSVISEPLVTHREHKNSLTAGPLRRYYKFNCVAMVKMYLDVDMKANFYLKRLGILKFQVSFAKSFIVSCDPIMFIRILPISLLPLKSIAEHAVRIRIN